jgi:hypothetical protein
VEIGRVRLQRVGQDRERWHGEGPRLFITEMDDNRRVRAVLAYLNA